MSLGRSGSVTQTDVRTPNMMQTEDAATQLLMAFVRDPQGFLSSLGMGQAGQPPAPMDWQANPFAQRAAQPGISQMLYGAGAPSMRFGAAPPSGVQPGPTPQWTPPPAASKDYAGEAKGKADADEKERLMRLIKNPAVHGIMR